MLPVDPLVWAVITVPEGTPSPLIVVPTAILPLSTLVTVREVPAPEAVNNAWPIVLADAPSKTSYFCPQQEAEGNRDSVRDLRE